MTGWTVKYISFFFCEKDVKSFHKCIIVTSTPNPMATLLMMKYNYFHFISFNILSNNYSCRS